jgi:hypothetical protein
MAALRDNTPIENQKAKALKVAMAIRGKRSGQFAVELGIRPSQMSKWITGGRYNEQAMGVIIQKLGYSVSEFLALGE